MAGAGSHDTTDQSEVFHEGEKQATQELLSKICGSQDPAVQPNPSSDLAVEGAGGSTVEGIEALVQNVLTYFNVKYSNIYIIKLQCSTNKYTQFVMFILKIPV